MTDYTAELRANAKKLGAVGKGLLAADESTGSIRKRLESVGKDDNEDNRREWRDVLLTTSEPIEDHISGVILFEETLVKHSATLESKYKGQTLVDVLKARDILPGIKVDRGTIPLPRTSPEETTTEGLDGLLARCKQYYEHGARFSKWRNTYIVSATTPSALAIANNAEILARYASVSQQAGLVPIVEPEVLMTHDQSTERSLEAHIAAYAALFERLALHKVDLAGLILKASMVVPGEKHSQPSAKEVAEATIACLSQTVPPQVPTVVFLSGGLSDADSILFLDAINKKKQENISAAPWALTFSFGRALQNAAMKSWANGDVPESQGKWAQRAKWCAEASEGKYEGGCPA